MNACDTYNKLIANFDMFNPVMQMHALVSLAKTLNDHESRPESLVTDVSDSGESGLTIVRYNFV